jgi:uncharacterized protein YndB with AHSA1/START domain
MSGNCQAMVKRVLDATVEEVYDAWTDPAILIEWLISGGRLVKADVRVGGEFHFDMGDVPTGRSPAHTGRYLVLERPTRIEFTWHSDWTRGESHVRIELVGHGDKTELTLLHTGLPDQAIADDHREGWADLIARAGEVIRRRRSTVSI